MSVLLEVTPWGAVETMTYDHATGSVIIKTEHDIAAKLDDNVARQNLGISKGADKDKDFWHAASIPLVVLQDWMTEFSRKVGRPVNPFCDDEDDPEWSRFVYGRLNDSEWRKLRTGLFRI